MMIESPPAKLRFADVAKSFATNAGTFIAVDGITLEIAAGTFFVIVGPSGCGENDAAAHGCRPRHADRRNDHDRAQ